MNLRENILNVKKDTKKILNDEEILFNLTLAKIHQSLAFHNESQKFYEEKIKRESEIKDLDRIDTKIFKETLKVLQEFNITLIKNLENEKSEITKEINEFKLEKDTIKILVAEILSENESKLKLQNIKKALGDARNRLNTGNSDQQNSANFLILNSILYDEVYEKNKESIITLLYSIKTSLKEEIKEKEQYLSRINSKFYDANQILSLIIKELTRTIELPEEEDTNKSSFDNDRVLLKLHQESYRLEQEQLENLIKDKYTKNRETVKKLSQSLKSIKALKSLLINNFQMLKDYTFVK
jgi:hypothetical protein